MYWDEWYTKWADVKLKSFYQGHVPSLLECTSDILNSNYPDYK